MKVGYLIGALGVGGSERQLCTLAGQMARRGHQVEVFAYDGPGHFDDAVRAAGASVRLGVGGSKLAKIRATREWMAAYRPQVVHAFMKRASSVAVLANIPRRRCRVIASDLSTATYARHKPSLWFSLLAFHRADCVVTQTALNKRSLEMLGPWLRGKVRVIRNGVDISRFRHSPPAGGDPFRFLAVGTVYGVKNPVRLVQAAALLRDRGQRFQLDWVGPWGQRGGTSPAYEEARALIDARGLSEIVRFSGPCSDMPSVYPRYDALVHVSVQEGMPNAVVEAMASGLPLVVSRVSDLPSIVAEASNGVVCEAKDPGSIAEAMRAMATTSLAQRCAMGVRSRELAERWFGVARFVEEAEKMYIDLNSTRS